MKNKNIISFKMNMLYDNIYSIENKNNADDIAKIRTVFHYE